MSYRGDDLDLRTPRGWTAASEGAGPDGEEASNGSLERYAPTRRPIWVDETVLACCNHAFDLAVANRAPEVRLEHLLHAMTRVEGAAETLEARGARVFNLRRETAAAIAHDMPVIAKDAAPNPRRSDELEEILRRAAAQAFRYGSSPDGDPAGVDDIVDVLSDARLDIAGLATLGRHSARGGRDFPPRRSYVSGAGGPFPRERGRHASMIYDGPQDGAGAAPRRDMVEHVEAGKGVETPPIVERLQALEHVLRDLKTGAASQSGMLQSAVGQIERASRAAASEAASRLDETLKALGTRLDRAPGWPANALAPLDDRLAIIEEAVLNSGSGGGTEYAAIGAEIKTLAGALARVDGVRTALDAHYAGLKTALDGKMSEVGGKLGEKLGALFAEAGKRNEDRAGAIVIEALDGQTAALKDHASHMIAKTGEGWSALVSDFGAAHAQRLNALETAITGALRLVEARQKTVANGIEQFGKATGECLDHVDGRLERLETSHARAMTLIESMHRLTVERHRWRNRFWRWLFGANDWIAASWPDGAARLDAEIEREAARLPRP